MKNKQIIVVIVLVVLFLWKSVECLVVQRQRDRIFVLWKEQAQQLNQSIGQTESYKQLAERYKSVAEYWQGKSGAK